MKFNNRHNEPAILPDGREIWLSRSVAVVSMVIVRTPDKDFVLAVHRHPESTFPNLWCMPCGFLDWDETAGDAAIRETWEEAGVDLLKLKKTIPCHFDSVFKDSPWTVSSSPEIGSQNVVFHFASVFETEDLPELSLDYTEPNELQDVRWIPVEEAIKMELAFNHAGRIEEFYTSHV